jgi:hypothetical protein
VCDLRKVCARDWEEHVACDLNSVDLFCARCGAISLSHDLASFDDCDDEMARSHVIME